MMNRMVYLTAAAAAVVCVSTVLAGNAPSGSAAKSCHGRRAYTATLESAGCHGALLQPSYTSGGCHGGGVTFAERRAARSAARANFSKTMDVFLEAARRGDLAGAVDGPELSVAKLSPVPAPEPAGCPCANGGQCKCAKTCECNCQKVIVSSPSRRLFRRGG